MKPRTIQPGFGTSLSAVVLGALAGAVVPKLWASLGCAWAARRRSSECSRLPTAEQLKTFLANAASGTGISASLGAGTGVGGLFGGHRMWAAVVNRDGEICAYAASTSDPCQVFPGSQQVAKAKAYTANAFSVDTLPQSTARLYTCAQPGHSTFGLNNSNPFNASFLAPVSGSKGGKSQIAGGIITFGGGVPLYSSAGSVIGGLGVAGDTACADHEIAKRVRDLAGLNPPGGPLVDDISYSAVDGASMATHPVCEKTIRNGAVIGDENPASGY